MSRLLLIGAGPLPSARPRELGFPQLRTRQLLLPLLDAGHEVLLASLIRRDLAPPDGLREPVERRCEGRVLREVVVLPDEPGRFLRLRDLRRDFAPDATITAGPFLPMAAGARAAGDEPLWIDVPGDPMCEAQAKALRSGSPDPIHRYRQMLGLALARGDRFSVISDAQRGSLIGALGLAGRLTGEAAGTELVEVMRGCVSGLPEGDVVPEGLSALPDDALPLLFCGGYNNWLDGDTLFAGVLAAMDQEPRLHYLSTGGGLPGHDDGTFSRFRSAALASPHRDRFHFLGWVPMEALPAVFARSWLSISLDRPCYEAEFGARTRILESLERGVPVLSTDLCELTHELAAAGLLHPAAVGDAPGLTRTLLRLAREGAGDTQAWAPLRDRYGLLSTTAPLLAWAAAPRRAPVGLAVDFLDDSWQELARLQDRLEEVWKSPTWRTLGRLHQLLRRR